MATLLVVDDSAMDRRLVGGILDKNPEWTVIYAVNGKEAMAEIESHIPDLVLTDMQMPEMNGLQLVTAVKEEYPLIPVVLMTSQGSEEIAVQALRQGAASYVPKRRLSQELRETVERVPSASHLDRSVSRLMHRVHRHETIFVLETDSSLVPSVVNYVQQAMTRMRFCDDTDCLRVGVALEERYSTRITTATWKSAPSSARATTTPTTSFPGSGPAKSPIPIAGFMSRRS